MSRVLLRLAAVAIAAVALLDPAVTVPAAVKPPATIVVVSPRATSPAGRLAEALADDFDVVIRQVVEGDGAAACVEDGPCVLATDGRVPSRVTADAATPVWALAVPAATPDVAVLDAWAGLANPAAAAEARVRLQGAGMAGRRSRVTVLDAGVPVGEAEVAWEADGVREIGVPWWPMGDGTRRLRVTAVTDGDEEPANDALDVAIEVGAAPLPVIVYEPRPSWAATFVRRAIEADARWDVRVVARLGPTVVVSTGEDGRLTDAMLSVARVVIVGAPEAVTAPDAERLARFVRVRGGTLVLLPDRAPSGPLADLMGDGWRERLEAAPVAVGLLRATELLVASAVPSAAILADAEGAPVIVAHPTGRGRVVVGGAMDAWRYRADGDAAFDRFWQALVADGADAAGPALQVDPSPRIVVPGQVVAVDVRMRTMVPGGPVTVGARLECADGDSERIRLWPAGPAGLFEGTVRPRAAGRCEVSAWAHGGGGEVALEAAAGLIVAPGLALGGAEPGLLDQVVGTSGGHVVSAGGERLLAGAIRDAWAPAVAAAPWYPMRSPWWVVLLAACLGTEWYLRRVSGLR